jgi:hypothetical protein
LSIRSELEAIALAFDEMLAAFDEMPAAFAATRFQSGAGRR